jgi:hypothetical protein
MQMGDFGMAESIPSILLELRICYRGTVTAARAIVFTGLSSAFDEFRLLFVWRLPVVTVVNLSP